MTVKDNNSNCYNCNETVIHAMKELAQGSNITELAKLLAEKIEETVIITDLTNRVLTYFSPKEKELEIPKFIPLKRYPKRKIIKEYRAEDLAKDKNYYSGMWETNNVITNYTYFPISINDEEYGNCVIICKESELNEDKIKLIEKITLVFLIAIREKQQNIIAKERFLNEIVYDVLYNNYDSKVALYEKVKILGWDMDGPYAIVIIDAPKASINTVKKVGADTFNSIAPIYATINDKVVVILSLNNLPNKHIETSINRYIKDYISNIQSNHITDVVFGISKTAKTLTDLHKTFQEAKIALELGKVFNYGQINHFEKMGFLKFIFTASAQELQEYEERILGKIIAHDFEQDADLLETLRVYIEQNGQIANTARALYVHENTLRNRLKRIEELIDLDLNKIDNLINIYIALQILALDSANGN